ncbi:MAG: VWA domain-containing protein [Anaerolineales bacterium]|nr:VWA domain-containing protein [Anaerolineales bacterium]
MSDFLRLYSLCNRPTLPVSRSPQLVYFLTDMLPGLGLADIRAPLNLVLALDRSAAMAGEPLRELKQAVIWLLEQLHPDDVISVVVFGKQARTVIPAQEVGSRKQLPEGELYRRWSAGVRGVGKQRLSSGLAEALNQASRWHRPDRVSRIILVVGGRSDDSLQAVHKAANQAGAQGIPIVCIGLGNEWDEELLIELSDRSVQAPPGTRSGMVYYVGDIKEIRQTFDRVYRSVQICLQDTCMNIRPARGVQIRQVWQTRPVLRDIGSGAIRPDRVAIQVGEMGIDGASFLLEALLEPRQAGAVRIAQEEVSFCVPGEGKQLEQNELVVEFSKNLAVTSRLEGYVMDVVQKAQSLQLQSQALIDADAGEIGSAIQKLRQVVPVLMSQGEILLADRMRKEVDYLFRSGHITAEGRKLIRLAFRER